MVGYGGMVWWYGMVGYGGRVWWYGMVGLGYDTGSSRSNYCVNWSTLARPGVV